MSMDYSNKLLYGKNTKERIVAIEINNENAEIFTEEKTGEIKVEVVGNLFWILSNKQHSRDWIKLDGNNDYSYGLQLTNEMEFQKAKNILRKQNKDIHCVNNPIESLMIKDGYTMLKGMEIEQISVLSFDIETTGLNADKESIILISNTFRFGDKITRKLFSYDEYKNNGEMLTAWCDWVRKVNPTILCGHNINAFDLNHMCEVADFHDVPLILGRNDSPMRVNKYESKFRIDGTRDLHYNKCSIYGRQIIDTLFLSYRYDSAKKKYESYGLKNIIKQEKLEKEGRVFYDASKIRFNYKNPEEFQKIKEYCIHDADDSLALFDLMIPPFFYMTQMIPKPLQMVIESASGSQINSLMCRAYLQDGHGLPKATDVYPFEGAISFAIPGIYLNVFKVDVASLYPSIMRQYKIYDKNKDPKAYFLELVETLTVLRLKYKKLYKETKNPAYEHLQNSFKILINSMYGFMGASGLNFNSIENAALVTRYGREVLEKSIMWATGKNAKHWSDKIKKDEE